MQSIKRKLSSLDNPSTKITKHQKKVMDGYKKTDYTDICIIVGDYKFYLVKDDLLEKSTYFEIFFELNCDREINLTDNNHDPEQFRDLLDCIFACPTKKINKNNYWHILQLADYYNFFEIYEECKQFMLFFNPPTTSQLDYLVKDKEFAKKLCKNLINCNTIINFENINNNKIKEYLFYEVYSQRLSHIKKLEDFEDKCDDLEAELDGDRQRYNDLEEELEESKYKSEDLEYKCDELEETLRELKDKFVDCSAKHVSE